MSERPLWNMVAPAMEFYRGLRAKKWLLAAMFVEFLSLAGAISAIPSLGLIPLLWAIAAVGILSTAGVVIVTAHFILEYNRRPLNDVQKTEVEEMFSRYLPKEQIQKFATKSELPDFAKKSELPDFVKKSELFWLWRYQESVMNLAWTAYGEPLSRPGYVLVAELTGASPFTGKIEFALLPPPIEAGECLSNAGEDPPKQFSEWGNIFKSQDLSPAVVFYRSASRKIKYLEVEGKIVFDDRLAAPVQIAGSANSEMPELKKLRKVDSSPSRWGEYDWQWKWLTPMQTEG